MNIHSVSKDHYYMKLAINLSERGLGNTWPNPSLGAIIVKNDKILSSGWTQPKGNPHAEIVALEKNSNFFNGSTLYTTLEPCVHYGKSSPCVDAIIKAKIKRVVIATLDPNPRAVLHAYSPTVPAPITTTSVLDMPVIPPSISPLPAFTLLNTQKPLTMMYCPQSHSYF